MHPQLLDNQNNHNDDESQPLLPYASASASYQQSLTWELVLPHGTTITADGISTVSRKLLPYILVGVTLALLSGASGFEGADEEGGLAIGLGGWGATSGLNFDGYMQFILQLLCGAELPSCCNLVSAIIAGFVFAAMPPAILAGRGAVETFYGIHGTDEMNPAKWAVGSLFGGINWIVSGALNTKSLLNLLPGFKDYFKRIFSSTRIWQSNLGEFAVRAILLLLFFPSLFAALMATVARGYDTFSFAEQIAIKLGAETEGVQAGVAYTIFGATGFPGFAMFLYGLLKLTLFIEKIIHFIFIKRKKRRFSLPGSDIVFATVAFGLALTFAFFVFENYRGLSSKAYSGEWMLGKLISHILGSVDAFVYASSVAAGINLVQRSVNFMTYLQSISRFHKQRCATPEQRETERSDAQTLYDDYCRDDPDASRTMDDFIENIGQFQS